MTGGHTRMQPIGQAAPHQNGRSGRGTIEARLRAGLKGEVIGPGHPSYDEARGIYYTGFDRRPAAIVRPIDAREVARVVGVARDGGVELAVRSGGHSVAGHSTSDGGIVLDLSALRALEVDAAGRSAWAGAGLTAGDYTREVGTRGVATGFGDSPSVGLGGITLGGGVGYLHRKLGLTLDSLLAVELVTAEGEILQVDAESHPDLFWAVRGGGGNFGVVTRFRLRLHDVDEVMAGVLILPATPEVVASFVGEAADAPEELSGMINVTFAPPLPFIAPEHHGKPIVLAALAWAGARKEGEAVFERLRSLARPIVDGIRPLRYREIYDAGPEPPRAPAASMRPFFMDRVDVASIETAFDHLQRSDARMRVVQFRVLGGQVARVPADATAFAHRDRRFMVGVGAIYDDLSEAPRHEAWAAGLADALRQGEAGAYVGFLGGVDEAGVREAYPGATWDRLRRVKGQWDPENLFRLNQNVPPLVERRT